jgi:hypothetical protein
MKDFIFESLNGDFLKSGINSSDSSSITYNSQATDHACLSHGCGFSSGLLISGSR